MLVQNYALLQVKGKGTNSSFKFNCEKLEVCERCAPTPVPATHKPKKLAQAQEAGAQCSMDS